mmetsp:Transcript_37655/g.118716  ORF Transcript_37655/g.118716 Transcript_37655/m.118716 type:complete len:217 (-) Transcript_37655:2254-2904(-)
MRQIFEHSLQLFKYNKKPWEDARNTGKKVKNCYNNMGCICKNKWLITGVRKPLHSVTFAGGYSPHCQGFVSRLKKLTKKKIGLFQLLVWDSGIWYCTYGSQDWNIIEKINLTLSELKRAFPSTLMYYFPMIGAHFKGDRRMSAERIQEVRTCIDSHVNVVQSLSIKYGLSILEKVEKDKLWSSVFSNPDMYISDGIHMTAKGVTRVHEILQNYVCQ